MFFFGEDDIARELARCRFDPHRPPIRHPPSHVVLLGVAVSTIVFGWLFAPMFGSGNLLQIGLFLALGMTVLGMNYGPIGAVLSGLFPTEVRYTGSSLTYNLGGILGASLAPYIATWLARNHGLASVGYYLSSAAALTFVALLVAGKKQMDHDPAASSQ